MIWASWPQLVGSADVAEEPRSKTARTSPTSQRRLMAYLRPRRFATSWPLTPRPQVLVQDGPRRASALRIENGGPCLLRIEDRQALQPPGPLRRPLTRGAQARVERAH